MKTDTDAAPFSVGDLVTTKFYPDERGIVRRVLSIEKSDHHSGGWVVSADAGCPCYACGRPLGQTVFGAVDWFKKWALDDAHKDE